MDHPINSILTQIYTEDNFQDISVRSPLSISHLNIIIEIPKREHLITIIGKAQSFYENN